MLNPQEAVYNPDTESEPSASALTHFTVRSWDPSSRTDSRIDYAGSSDKLLLLPDYIDDDGRALYRDDNAGLVKTALADDIPLQFAYPKGERAYLSEHGAAEVVANLFLLSGEGVLTSAAVWAAKLLVAKVRAALGQATEEEVAQAPVRLRIAKIEHSPGSQVISGIDLEGPVGSISEALAQLLQNDRPALPDQDAQNPS